MDHARNYDSIMISFLSSAIILAIELLKGEYCWIFCHRNVLANVIKCRDEKAFDDL